MMGSTKTGEEMQIRVLWGRGEDENRLWLAVVELQSRAALSRFRPFHLHLLLDCSASMREESRYGMAMETLKELLDSLGPTDRFSLTLFSHESHSIVRGASARWARKNFGVIQERIDGSPLLFSPRTHLAAALAKAVDLLPAEQQWSNRVLVLTDGEVMDSDEAAAVINPWRAILECRGVGFGPEFDAGRLVHALRGVMGRRVQHLTRPEDVPQLVGMIAAQGRTVVANDLRLNFSVRGASLAWAYRHIPEAARLEEDGLGSAHDVISLVEQGRTYRYLVACEWPPFGDDCSLDVSGSYRVAGGSEVRALWHQSPVPGETGATEHEEIVRTYARLLGLATVGARWTLDDALQRVRDWREYMARNFRYADHDLLLRLDELEARLRREGLTEALLGDLERVQAKTTTWTPPDQGGIG